MVRNRSPSHSMNSTATPNQSVSHEDTKLGAELGTTSSSAEESGSGADADAGRLVVMAIEAEAWAADRRFSQSPTAGERFVIGYFYRPLLLKFHES